MIAESWEWINLRWWAPDEQTEETPELLRMGEKNSQNRKQLWEDGIKLELRTFGRTGKDLRGTLLRSSKSENDDEKHHHELLTYSGRMKNKEVEPTRKNNLRVAPEKLKESSKILGKGLWVRAHSKLHHWIIAPVELNGLNEIASSKELEWIENGNLNLLRYLHHSGTIE